MSDSHAPLASVRLQKFLADCGVASRRKCEELITTGQVQVNGQTVTELGVKVIPGKDRVQFGGKLLTLDTVRSVYVVLHKPTGCVTTVSDPQERVTVMEYCAHIPERIYPVGRLDFMSEGLLLLTNDGELAQSILHPSQRIIKTYEVLVREPVSPKLLMMLERGTHDAGEFLKPKKVSFLGNTPRGNWIEFQLEEGKNREIRRICEAHHLTILTLKRVAFGGLELDGIPLGKTKLYSKEELLRLIRSPRKKASPRPGHR